MLSWKVEEKLPYRKTQVELEGGKLPTGRPRFWKVEEKHPTGRPMLSWKVEEKHPTGRPSRSTWVGR